MNFIRQYVAYLKIKIYVYWKTSTLPYQQIPEFLKDYRIRKTAKYLCWGGLRKNSWLLNKLQQNKFY